MPLYRTDGPWGFGKGTNLEPGEVDQNFYELDQRAKWLEENPPVPVDISNIEVVGTQFVIHLSNGNQYGPYTLPIAPWVSRGKWQPFAQYFAYNIVTVDDDGVYFVQRDHTSAAEFDPNAQESGESLYFKVFDAVNHTDPSAINLRRDNDAGTIAINYTTAGQPNFRLGQFGNTEFALQHWNGATWEDLFTTSGGSLIIKSPFVRERLNADRTYYVAATGGSDSNDGLTVGTPFATIAHAIEVACDVDFNGRTVTISCVDGAYSPFIMERNWVGGGRLILRGNPTNPENVTIISSSHSIILNSELGSGVLRIDGFKLSTTVDGNTLSASGSGLLELQNIDFGPAVWNHLYLTGAGLRVRFIGDYKISGGSQTHINATLGGDVLMSGREITLTGTPAFSQPFVSVGQAGRISADGLTYTGSATGVRYAAFNNGVIFVNGGGPNIFPGDDDGYTFNGGQYI